MFLVMVVVAFCRTVCVLCFLSTLIISFEVLENFVLVRKSVENIGEKVDFSIVNRNSKISMLKK